MLDEIATKLAALGVGTIGTDLFTGFMPDDPDACIVVFEYAGRAPEGAFGRDGIAVEHAAFQVRVRGPVDDYDLARAKIETIYQALGQAYAVTLSGVRYNSIKAGGSPALLEVDEKHRPHFVVSFDTERVRP